ncbi:uncharacterized protein DS421_11g335710 [Arachis hypogaea]|nr:uncharacterized protein DS421_11g335710 [Arachis hypogaea]
MLEADGVKVRKQVVLDGPVSCGKSITLTIHCKMRVKSSFCEADENVRFYIGTPRGLICFSNISYLLFLGWAFDILGWGFSDLAEKLTSCDVVSKHEHFYQVLNKLCIQMKNSYQLIVSRRTWGTQIHWSGHGHFVPWQEFKSSGQNDLGQVANDMKYKAKDAASRATESFKSTASGASEYASQRVADAREAVSGAMGYGRENAGQAYDGDGKIIRMPTDRETDAKIMMQ